MEYTLENILRVSDLLYEQAVQAYMEAFGVSREEAVAYLEGDD